MQPKLIYDSIHGNIELSGLETIILKSSFANRLHQILQNSTAYLVFPSCKTSRFEHSLGVMSYTSLLFLNGLKNSAVAKDYLSDKKGVLLNLINKDFHFFNDYYDETIPEKNRSLIFLNYLNSNFKEGNVNKTKIITDPDHCEKVNNELMSFLGDVFIEKNLGLLNSNLDPVIKFTYMILFQTIRLYGLLHDIGHLPFSHIFEFSIDSVYLNSDRGSSENSPTLEKIRDIVNSGDKIHEIIGKRITRLILQEIERRICNDNNLTPEKKIFRVFSVKCIELFFNEIEEGTESKLASLSAIVDNTIDADRLDFVQRDGYVSGVSKSSGNVERIIKMFYLMKLENTTYKDHYYFVPSIQSLHDVEKLLSDRYNIYQYMVNHHSVKRSDYILQKNIELQLETELKGKTIGSNALIEINGVIDVIDVIHSIIKGEGEFYENKYSFTQLTDFWLLSFFSKKYFETLYKATQKGSNKKDNQLSFLSEIYESKRSFKSLWKRIYDYKSFITELGKTLCTDKETLRVSKFNLDSLSDYGEGTEKSKLFPLKKMKRLLSTDSGRKLNGKDHYEMGKIAISLLSINNLGWCRKIENYANNNNSNKKLILLVAKTNISDGLKNFLLVDNKDGKTVYHFDEMSALPETLKIEAENAIKFFVYFNEGLGDNKISNGEIEDSVRKTIKISIVKIVNEIISNFTTSKAHTNE